MVQDEHESRRAEERVHRAGAGRLARACSWLALVLLVPFALLVAVGPSVAWRLMPVHPARAAIAPDALAPREAIAQLDALDPTTDDGLAEAARIFSSAIVDHWPARDEVDPAVATTLFEHPPRWAVIQIGRVLPDSLATLVPNHAERTRIERREWRSAVMLGVGTDGQRALALARYLREKGVDAWPVVAAGRAVCVLGSPEGVRALDPASGAIVEIAARTDYGEPTTLLSRRGRVWWTLALCALAFFAWGSATGRVDPRWSVLVLLEIAHQTGVAFLWWAAVLGALGVLAWAYRTERLHLRFLKPLAGFAARLSRRARGLPVVLSSVALACRCGGALSAVVATLSAAAVLAAGIGPWLAERVLPPHPLRDAAAECKPGLACIDADEAIARLEALDPSTEEGLVEANRIFAAAILHHWPARADEAPDTAVRLYEDLPLWWEMRAAAALGDDEDWAALAWRERGRWRSAIRMGVGFCSQHAIAISDYLREKGVAARPFGLDGHVVARVETSQGEWILDPDYALVMRRSIEEAGADLEGTRDAYLAAGVEPSIAADVAATFGPEGNTEYTITFVGGDPSRSAAWQRRAFTVLALSGLAAMALWWCGGACRRLAVARGAGSIS
jgi:hypothetical protein